MALEQGDVVKIYIDNAGGTALALPGQTTGTLSYANESADKTSKGDTFRLIEATKSQITISFEGFYDHSDASVTRVLALLDAGAVTVSGEIQRSSSQYAEFTGVLDDFTIDHTDGEMATYSGTITVSGALTLA